MEMLTKLPPMALVVLTIVLVGIVSWFGKQSIDIFKKIKNDFEHNFLLFNRRMDISDLKNDARDYALNKVLPKNGDTYQNHLNSQFEALVREYDAKQV